jgi:DnaJ-class molecular chaperone
MLPRNKFKEVYRILAKEFHPDRNPSPEAKEKFKLVNEIYCVLSDQVAKTEYDALYDIMVMLGASTHITAGT